MEKTRRNFLAILGTWGASFAFFAKPLVAQGSQGQSSTTQNPPTFPKSTEPKGKDGDVAPTSPSNKALLEENDKDIKKSVEKLFQLASELKTEVEKTDSVQVLSLGLVRKAEEIEKLAKEIKTRAKG